MRAVGQLICLFVTVVVLPLSAILLIVAVTWQGRAFACATLAGLGVLGAVVFGRPASRVNRLRIGAGLGLVGAALLAAVAWQTPSGVSGPTPRVRHLYFDGQQHGRWSLANVVPEIDQLMVGFAVTPFLDPLLTHRQAAPLKGWTRDIYGALESDAEFRALGSAMGQAYTDLRGGKISTHAFLYVPPTLDSSRPASVLLFFHGSGGNFKAYLWLLSKVADRRNAVLIAPSCGMGNWSAAETRARASAALAAVQRTLPIDAAQVHAIGLSNGGLALTHLLAASAGDYRSFIFISPVFHEASVRELSFASEVKPAVLIVTGARDDRVPLSYVANAAERLTSVHAEVTLEVVEDADHFLLFSHREQLLRRIEQWLMSHR